jgi:hypothetical protein
MISMSGLLCSCPGGTSPVQPRKVHCSISAVSTTGVPSGYQVRFGSRVTVALPGGSTWTVRGTVFASVLMTRTVRLPTASYS